MTNMDVVILIVVIIIILLIIAAIWRFDLHVENKFGYHLIRNKRIFICFMLLTLAMFGAMQFDDLSKNSKQPEINTTALPKKISKNKSFQPVNVNASTKTKSFLERKFGDLTSDEQHHISIGLWIISALGYLGILWYNLKKTNVLYGIGGTLLQTPIFILGSSLGWLVVAIFAVLLLLLVISAFSGGRRRYYYE